MSLTRFGRFQSVRLASTLVGHSGRTYILGKTLSTRLTKPEYNVYQAQSGDKSFVVKATHEEVFNKELHLLREFGSSPYLRLPVDYNNESAHTLVFDYFRSDLLGLVHEHSDIPIEARKLMLRQAGEALKDLHSKNWIHLDVKPDNIFVDWSLDDRSKIQATRASLGDFEHALRLEGNKPLRLPERSQIGNLMWLSPEGLTGQGTTKPSDVFAFGLVCLYGITGLYVFGMNPQDLKENKMSPEQEVLRRAFLFFGPDIPPALLEQVDDESWAKVLTGASEWAQALTTRHEGFHIKDWAEDLLEFPHLTTEAKDLLYSMVNLDPTARATMDEVMDHRWWTMASS
ncbi:kinase-like protein [Hypoxylon sp. NC1633]|nr:kinase-like protein [Hypoxylon sp. NC1633]